MNQAKKEFEIIGLMSGSSLDGLDVAWCSFSFENGHCQGKILKAKTFPYPKDLELSLAKIRQATALELIETEVRFLNFCKMGVESMIREMDKKPLAIASHGHTVFHNPSGAYTLQIGNGGLLSGQLSMPVVSDFRTLDVGNGGQGAPLVPGAERFLFSGFDACLNLGGIANVSFPKSNPFLGFDLAPCNQLLNQMAQKRGKAFDEGGKMASSGKLLPALLSRLDSIYFYSENAPKSLGNETVEKIWKPVLEESSSAIEDILHSLCVHMAKQIAKGILTQSESGKLLITGGGAFNHFLRTEIENALGTKWQIVVPDPEMVSFKEAYCFAFLGLMRIINQENGFKDVTGSKENLCLGAVYGSQWLT